MPTHEPRQLVYLVYGGKTEYHQEAKYSILSALHHAPGQCPRILVYTDEPGQFAGWPVEVVGLDADTLTSWTGPAAYLHRRKAAAIRDALQYAERSIFIDTDTFFLRSPVELFERLAGADWLVDEIEGAWGECDRDALLEIIGPYLVKRYGVDESMLLINSGVLGFQVDASGLMDETLALIDLLHPMVPKVHTIEQFAVAVAAKNLGRPAESRGVIKHYYSSKSYWRHMISAFFERHGEVFTPQLVRVVPELPSSKLRPPLLHRLVFRVRSIALPAKLRAQAKLAYYAAVMRNTPYEQACARAYAEELARKALPEGESVEGQPWSKMLSDRQRQRLNELLLRG
ncbi:hypothetical protein [Metapseudomonas otitidis]|uniref:hypothetical protein n=1 Tax=Metapseudomonas otitidis TaxID=319939 RepID=UPI002098188B|nr:hypothetical protein [Pseudomonas otitidis]MCO7553491.1 hypothetical protein [Pseudomonas otitidis]